MILLVLAALPAAIFLILWRRRPSPVSAAPTDGRQTILIDGSNVIHWQDNAPQFAPLKQVVHDLSRRGFKPGVVFDANIGYKLAGKFMGERALSRMLSLPRDQIPVVPKGQQADPFLLETARDLRVGSSRMTGIVTGQSGIPTWPGQRTWCAARCAMDGSG